jgi:hypothetical protein
LAGPECPAILAVVKRRSADHLGDLVHGCRIGVSEERRDRDMTSACSSGSATRITFPVGMTPTSGTTRRGTSRHNATLNEGALTPATWPAPYRVRSPAANRAGPR